MDPLTDVWVTACPEAAFRAGVSVELESAGPASPEVKATLVRRLQQTLTQCDPNSIEAAFVRSLLVEKQTEKPFQSLRQAVEWTRAAVYRNVLPDVGEELDRSLARRVHELEATLPSTSNIERVLMRNLGSSLRGLARDARLHGTMAATTSLLERLVSAPALDDLSALQNALRGQPSSVVTAEEHATILRDGFGFDETAEHIEAISWRALDEEVARTREAAEQIVTLDPTWPGQLDDLANKLAQVRACESGSVIALAEYQTRVALSLFESELIGLSEEERNVTPERTPTVMCSLTTEGEEYVVDGLTAKPKAFCFITEGEIGSHYTLANVLYHELAHCWHMLKASRATDVPGPLRLSGLQGAALLEGIALHREFEVYELFCQADPQSAYGGLFDNLGVTKSRAQLEFAFETHYWRLARVVRALFDSRVHSGRQGYLDFLAELESRTALSADRIHKFCAHFFESPGMAPSYWIGAMKLSALQADLCQQGMSRRDFNTRAASIGMLPPRFWRQRILRGHPHA